MWGAAAVVNAGSNPRWAELTARYGSTGPPGGGAEQRSSSAWDPRSREDDGLPDGQSSGGPRPMSSALPC